PDNQQTVAYVGTVLTGLSACVVEPTSGKPDPMTGFPIDRNTSIAALAVAPSQHFLYVEDESKHIDVYPIAADGTIPAQPSSTAQAAETLNTLALDPKGRFAYAGSVAAKAIYVFTVDASTGALSPAGDPVHVGSDPDHGGANYVTVDPSGTYLYVSQASEFGIRGFKIDQTGGGLMELEGSPFGATGIPDGHNVFGGALAFEPGGAYLYSVGLALCGFKLDAGSGKLALVDGSPFTLDVQSDSDATNLAVDPLGSYL